MRYKPRSIAALHVALGRLSDMHVKADRDVEVSAKTVGELRKVTAWPENLVIATPQECHTEVRVRGPAEQNASRQNREGAVQGSCRLPMRAPPFSALRGLGEEHYFIALTLAGATLEEE